MLKYMSSAQTSTFRWFEPLPRLGSDEEFTALRKLLADSGYEEDNIFRRAQVEGASGYSVPPAGGRTIEDALDALVALFFDCGFVDEARLGAVLPPGSVALLDSLGLLGRTAERPSTVYSAAAILPASGLLMLCDRANAPDGVSCALPPDVVYPPIFDTTRRFVGELPETACEAMLDIGTGAGIAALLGARHARHVWATDIAERSVLFTAFNSRLAGFDNVTAVSGDMYAPVEGLTFDRIVIHPPYVPAKQPKFVFADAGDDGELIIRRAIEGLPRYLRPGGRFYSLQSSTDREGEMFEQRVRKWLGAEENQFDVAVSVHSIRTPLEFLSSAEVRGRMTLEASRNWLELWANTKTEAMVYSALLIERQRQPRNTVTRRSFKGSGYSGRDLERLLEWNQSLNRPDRVEMLLASRPVAYPDNELRTISRMRDGAFRAEEYSIEIPGPFRNSLKCEEWLTHLLPRCTGERTWEECFELARREGWINPSVAKESFAQMLVLLVSLGAVTLADGGADRA